MYHLLKQTNGVQTPSLSINASFVVDTVRVQGPAREKLRKRFGNEMRNFLAGLVQPLDEVVRVGMASDTGTRPRNEDSVVALLAHLDDDHMPIPMMLVAVADGIGGNADGDLASALAIQTLTDCVVDRMVDADAGTVSLDPLSIETLLVEAFGAAHHKIRRQTASGGSTLTGALIVDRTAYVAHVGDSRAYLLDAAGDIEVLTRDHRFVREWEELGIISGQEAINHPQGHILYRALGKLDQCEVDITRRNLGDGSRLLLCTDGVWETVEPGSISRIIRRSKHPQYACEVLISDALASNARDDVTAVLVEIPA
jgi:serine/threonine protein phosphatase PrpC